MSDKRLTIYKPLDLHKPTLPARSYLYQLDPIGIGTSSTESLTSFISRLAEAHCVNVGTLVSRALALSLKNSSKTGEPYDNTTGIFSRTGRALNGIGLMAANWVEVLEKLTLLQNLHYLTMLTWTYVLPPKGLLRQTRAWCPHCYEEWRTSGSIISQPLLWSLEVVTVCPSHHQRLQTKCSHCNQLVPELGHHSRPGYCSKCRQWLGNSASFQTCEQALSEDELNWQIWVSQAVGELIAAAPSLSQPICKENIASAISSCVNQLKVDDGSLSAFANKLQITASMAWHWQTGQKLITLGRILQICHTFEISVIDFLTGEVVIGSVKTNTVSPKKFTPKTGRGPSRSSQELEKIKSTLESILKDEYPPPTFKKVKKRYLHVCLRHFFSSLCCAIAARHAEYRRATRMQRMKCELEAVLKSEEFPPPSMKDIAQRLPYGSDSILRRYFPDLCRSISARYMNYIQSHKAERIQQLCNSIRQTAKLLQAQGVYPSSNRVISELGIKMGTLLDPVVLTVLKEVQQELGLNKAVNHKPNSLTHKSD